MTAFGYIIIIIINTIWPTVLTVMEHNSKLWNCYGTILIVQLSNEKTKTKNNNNNCSITSTVGQFVLMIINFKDGIVETKKFQSA